MATVDCGYPASPDLLAAIGPALEVNIGCDPDYVDGRRGVPRPQVTGVLALVDTGASECFIDASMAADLKLPIVDRQTVTVAHGLAEVNVYSLRSTFQHWIKSSKDISAAYSFNRV